MSDVKWIKIVTDIFDDEKILLIESMPDADSLIVIWFKLLCLAGKQNNGGVFMINDRIHYTDEMFATIFRRNVNTVRLALDTFERFGMIEKINDTVTIPNWEKHQQLDALEMGREKTRLRVAKHRERQKMLAQGNNENACNVTETECNADRIDKIRIDKRESMCEKRTTFSPPTIDDVTEYAKEKGYSDREFDPESFVNFYGSKGWVVGKSKMKDWRKAANGWVARYRKEHGIQKEKPVERDMTVEEIMRRSMGM